MSYFRRWTNFGIACVLAVAVLPLAHVAPAPAEEISKPALTVTGEGLALARPDLATILIGVVTQASRAGEALAQNSKAMSEVVAAAKADGVEARDIETTRLSVQPQYSRPAPGSREPARIVAYEVRNTVSVRIRDLNKLGALLDRLVMVGANEIRNIELSVAEPGPLRDAARVAAVKDAMRKANLYAEAAGVRIVRLRSLVEAAQDFPRPRALAAAPVAEARAAVPIEAGELEFRGRVTAVFDIEPR